MKNYGYLLSDPEIFSIFFNGISRSTRDNQQNDVILIAGPKGVGKTQLVKILAYLYHNQFPQTGSSSFVELRDYIMICHMPSMSI
jgi:Holliday junction resolvasome RuvABC ATP-dependent DNA helicase subunit